MDTDSFVLSVNTKDTIKTLKIQKIYLVSGIWMKIMNYSLIKVRK